MSTSAPLLVLLLVVGAAAGVQTWRLDARTGERDDERARAASLGALLTSCEAAVAGRDTLLTRQSEAVRSLADSARAVADAEGARRARALATAYADATRILADAGRLSDRYVQLADGASCQASMQFLRAVAPTLVPD